MQQNKCGAFKKHSTWNLIPSRPIKMNSPATSRCASFFMGIIFIYAEE